MAADRTGLRRITKHPAAITPRAGRRMADGWRFSPPATDDGRFGVSPQQVENLKC